MKARALAVFVSGLAALASAGCGGDDDASSTSASSSGSGGGAGGGCAVDPGEDPVLPSPARHTPRWAFEPWISKDISDTDDTRAFVKGFRDRDIPVGVVVLDSPWETSYNTFVPSPKRYHGFDDLLGDLHADDIRLVVWMTMFLNRSSYDLEPGGDTYTSPAPGYFDAEACGFFVNDGTTYGWWKGLGGAIDFFNPKARAFWHRAEDSLLDRGVDGFKLDFGDSYVRTDPVQTAKGAVTHQQYSEAYYQDYLAYGVSKRGRDFTTMTRAYDKSYDFEGRFYAAKEDSPIAWMGDNRRDWVGLADALDETFRSANAGYVVLGSDIGGYLDRDDVHLTETIPFDSVVFARWTAVGALSPFMQLHGRANITPWTVPTKKTEVVALYRYWAKLHHEMGGYWYSLAEEAYAGKGGAVRPEGAMASWAGDYRYRIGDAFLVAPVLSETGTRDVALPSGDAWYDWWNPANDVLTGGQTVSASFADDLAKIPLYVRRGAIVPLDVDDDATSLGDAASGGKLTVLVYPDDADTTFRYHEADDEVTTLEAHRQGHASLISLTRARRDTILRVRDDAGYNAITIDGSHGIARASRADFDANATGYWIDASTRSIWIHIIKGPGAHAVALAAN